MRALSLFLAALAGLSIPTIGLAAEAAPRADEVTRFVVDTSGVSRGVCALPRCGDAALALRLAESGFMVHAMDAAEARVAAVRKAARAAGLLGRSLYVETGSPAPIPFADNYVNLLVVADASDENLAALPLAEVLRVLAPETGRALVGLAPAAPGKLSREGLSQWLKQCPAAQSRVIEGESGRWALVSKPRQPGAVAWTHRLFSPANNPVSGDTACAWPLMTQWLGKPYLASEPLMLVAGGRLAAVELTNFGTRGTLQVFDAHNGMLLWRRTLPNAAVATRTSGMALLPDALYLAEGPSVLVFDPANGKEKGRVDCADLGPQVKWLVIEDGRLHVMAGSAERTVMASQTWKVFSTTPPNFSKGRGLGAYDLAAGKWLWTHREDDESLDEGLVGLCKGRLYYYVAGRHAVCRAAKTGRIVWTNAKVVESLKPVKVDNRGHIGALVCTEKFLAFHRTNGGTAILSASDGEPLWTIKATAIVFANDLLLRKGGGRWGDPSALEAATGAPSKAWPKMNLGGGCGAFTLTPNLLCGQMGLTYDFQAGQDLDAFSGNGPLMHKTPCLAGSFVAEGLLFFGSASCTCGYTVRGTVVQAPAAPAAVETTPATGATSGSKPVLPFMVNATDWPTFRATAARGNASRAKVPARPIVRWTWRPSPAAVPAEPDPLESCHEPVQATAAGDLVFVTEADGSVTALDLAGGRVRWNFPTAGRLFAPPTIATGRCFIGSGDGQVYCLEASTGRLLWRYRVAPADRRILVYGDLLSTWAITGGVLVHEGVAYAVAGILDGDGTHVAALDAARGAPKWRQDAAGHLDPRRRTGVAGAGYAAIGNGRLWLRRDSFDLATGEVRTNAGQKKPGYEVANGILERCTGVFADRFLVTGGRRFFEEQFAVHENRGHPPIHLTELAEGGTGKSPALTPWQSCRTIPAWDDRNLVALPIAYYQWSGDGKAPPCVREEDLVCWDTPRAVAELHKTIEEATKDPRAPKAAEYRRTLVNKPLWDKEMDKRKGEQFQAPQQVWRAEKARYIAAVLADNAVLAAFGTPAVPGLAPRGKAKAEPPAYGLAAYDRSNGKPLWEVALPGEPLMDGLSVARDGTVLVRLLDGSLTAVGASGER